MRVQEENQNKLWLQEDSMQTFDLKTYCQFSNAPKSSVVFVADFDQPTQCINISSADLRDTKAK